MQHIYFAIGISIGLISMCIAFAAKEMGDRIFQMSMTVMQITGAPLLAIFTMGIFLPFINAPVCITLCNSWVTVHGCYSPSLVSDEFQHPVLFI